jgi:glycine cleavage system H lipoate-binding protein
MSRRKIRGNRSEAMKEEKCPFLEVTKVTFCKAFPVKKMIPLDRSSSAKGVCTTDSFRQCPAFREINAHNSEAEHIRGFHLKAAYYFHPKHLWISPSEAGEGEVRVGIDDFSQKMMVAPSDGIIQSINRKITADPKVLNRDPYNEGWILSMHMAGEGLRRLFHGRVARKWLDCEVERLQRVFSADLGITATDGGESLPDISSRLTEAQWSRIVTLFLG